MIRDDQQWEAALSVWRDALTDYKARLSVGRLDSEYYKAGRTARRALRRCFNLAAKQRRIWSPGECRTFY